MKANLLIILFILFANLVRASDYKLITSLNEINADKRYVIASSPNLGGEDCFLLSTKYNSFLNGFIGEMSSSNQVEPMFWNIASTGGDKYLLSNDLGKFLGLKTNGENNLVLSSLDASETSFSWTLEFNKDHSLKINVPSTDDRVIKFYFGFTKLYSYVLEKSSLTSDFSNYVYLFEYNEEFIPKKYTVKLGGKSHIGTFYASSPTILPPNLSAYIISDVSNNIIKLTKYISTDETLPGKVPFIIEGEVNGDFIIEESNASEAHIPNYSSKVFGTSMEVVNNNTNLSTSLDLTYVLGFADQHNGDADYFGFYPYTGDKIPAHKIYILDKNPIDIYYKLVTDPSELNGTNKIVFVNKTTDDYYVSNGFSREILTKKTSVPLATDQKTFTLIQQEENTYYIKYDDLYLSTDVTLIKLTTTPQLWKIDVQNEVQKTFYISSLNTSERFIKLTEECDENDHLYFTYKNYYKDYYGQYYPQIYKCVAENTGLRSKRMKIQIQDNLNFIRKDKMGHTSCSSFVDLKGKTSINPQHGIFIKDGKKYYLK